MDLFFSISINKFPSPTFLHLQTNFPITGEAGLGLLAILYFKRATSIAFTSGLQLPQPVPAPVAKHNFSKLTVLLSISSHKLPSPTLLQEQTKRPITGFTALPLRNNCLRFSDNSVFCLMRSLNSGNSILSPNKMAPTITLL